MTTIAPEKPATCTLDGCDKPHAARGMCNPHYHRARRGGDPTVNRNATEHRKANAPRGQRVERGNCAADDCESKARSAKPGALCHTHEARLRLTGTLEPEPRLPAEPLNAYAASKGFPTIATGSTVSLTFADSVCCDMFGVHPFDVYGNAYFDLP